MKRKTAHKKKVLTHHSTHRIRTTSDNHSVILVRGWIFMVLFALMLGLGMIVGSYVNNQLNGGTPTVAGASIER